MELNQTESNTESCGCGGHAKAEEKLGGCGCGGHAKAEEKRGGCGCGGHHSGQEVRHAHSPEAEEMRAEGHQDLSEGRRNLGLRSAK